MSVEIETEWFTPAGKVRNVPMYAATIENRFLRTSRTIRGSDHTSVWQRATAQLEKWKEQEKRQRDASAKQDALERGEAEAEELDLEAREAIASVTNLLEATLAVDDRLDWDELRDKRDPKLFAFSEPAPAQPDIRPQVFNPTYQPHPPKPWYSFWPGVESAWHERCAVVTALNQSRAEQAQAANYQEALRCEHVKAAHVAAVQSWNERREAASRRHEEEVARFLEEQRNHNARVDAFKAAFERAVPAAVTEYLRGVFERSDYPDCFPVSHTTVEFVSPGFANVAIEVPSLDDLPNITGYTFVRAKCEPKAVLLKKREHAELYEKAVAQAVLRTLHEVFEADYVPVVNEAAVSAFVSCIDPATGKDQRDCRMAVSAKRAAFLALDLRRLDPVVCVKSLRQPSMVSR